MIKLETALKIANEHLMKMEGSVAKTALDTQTCWIFFASSEEEPSIGGAGVKVDKNTGELKDFILPNDENFELLEKSHEIELPPENSGRRFFVAQ